MLILALVSLLLLMKEFGLAIESILESRKKEGTFKSLLDFCRRVDTRTCNKKVIESLIKSGAMDSFGKTRNYLLSVYERVLTAASGEQKERASGQIFMFDVTPQAYKEPSDEYLLENIEPVDHTSEELLRMEKELLGLYISKHPLENLIDSLEGQVEYRVADVVEKYEGDIVKIGGLLTSIRKITTKKGDMMMVAALEDLSGSIPLVIFPKTYNKYVHLLNDDAVIIIKGKLNRDARTEEMNVWAETVEPLAELEKVRSLHIEVVELKDKAILERLKDILLFYRGNEPVIIYYDDQKVAAGSKYRVDINPELVERIEELLGTGAARVEQRHLKRMKNDLIKND